MIIRRFLQWTATAPADARAEGASALARAYIDGEFVAAERDDAESVIMALLDDPAPQVRLALAVQLAPSPMTPPAIATALAGDSAEIAALLLEHSPVLSVPELVDAVALGDVVTQSAIARRPDLGVGVSAALAEVATLPACVVLCGNLAADIPARALARMSERFGYDGDFRQALGARPDLPPGLRHDLVVDTADQLRAFAVGCGWLSPDRAARTAHDAVDRAAMTIGIEATEQDGPSGMLALVHHLRAVGRLTPALILRAAVCGNTGLVEAALSELSGVPASRVAGLLRGRLRLAFDALYARAGLPPSLRPAFTTAILNDHWTDVADQVTPQRERIGRVLACVLSPEEGLGTVAAMLRRLDAEAAREQARTFAQTLMRETTLPLLPRLSAADRSLPLSSAA